MTQSYSTTETKELSGVNSLVFTMFKMKENKDSESSLPKGKIKPFLLFNCVSVKPTLAVTIIPSFQQSMHASLHIRFSDPTSSIPSFSDATNLNIRPLQSIRHCHCCLCSLNFSEPEPEKQSQGD